MIGQALVPGHSSRIFQWSSVPVLWANRQLGHSSPINSLFTHNIEGNVGILRASYKNKVTQHWRGEGFWMQDRKNLRTRGWFSLR